MREKLLSNMRKLTGTLYTNDVNITHKRVTNFVTNI